MKLQRKAQYFGNSLTFHWYIVPSEFAIIQTDFFGVTFSCHRNAFTFSSRLKDINYNDFLGFLAACQCVQQYEKCS